MSKKVLKAASALAITATSIVSTTDMSVFANQVQNETKNQKEDLVQTIEDYKKVEAEQQSKVQDLNKKKKESEKELANNKNIYETQLHQKEALEDKINKEFQGLQTDLANRKNNMEQEQAASNTHKVNLENKLKQDEQKLQETIEALQNAELALEEAKEAAKEATSEKLTEASANVDKAQKAFNFAKKELDEVKVVFAAAQNDVKTKQDAYKNAQNQLTEAQNAQQQAKVELDRCKAILDEKKQILDATKDESVKQSVQEEVRLAKEAYDLAKTQKDQANQALQTARTRLEQTKASLREKEQVIEGLNQQVQAAKEALDASKAASAKVSETFNAKNMELAGLNTQKNTLTSEVQTAQQALTQATTEYNQAVEQTNASKVEVERAQKAYDDLKNSNGRNEAAIAKGSLGFFESMSGMDSEKAQDVLKTAPMIQYTTIGAKYDATGLENMKNTIAFMKECNELRARHNAAPLKVTHELMAISQVQTNASTYLRPIQHSGQYMVAENLAWGYRNPFRGWYDEEKKIYDSGDQNFQNVGHYLNIIDQDYRTTGFSIAYHKDTNVVTHGQVFSGSNGGYSVEEYEQMFMNYYNSITGANHSQEVARAKETLDQAIATHTRNQQDLATKESAKNTATTNLTTKQNELGSLQERIQTTQAEVSRLQEELEIKDQDMNQKQTAYDTKFNEKNRIEISLQPEMEGLRREIQQATTDVGTAQSNLNDKTTTLNQKKEDYDKKQELLNQILNGETQAQEQYDAALENHKKAQSSHDEKKEATRVCTEAVSKANEAVELAKQALTTATTQKDTKQQVFNEKQTLLEQANAELTRLQELINNVERMELLTYDYMNAKVEFEFAIYQGKEFIKEEIQKLDVLKQNLLALAEEENKVSSAKLDWEQLKQGKQVTFDYKEEALQNANKLMKEYVGISSHVQQAKFNFEVTTHEYEQLQKGYSLAEKEYESTKQKRMDLEKKLDALLEELAKQEHIVIQGVTGEKDPTNTGDTTSMYVLVGGMILSGTLAVLFLNYLKKQHA